MNSICANPRHLRAINSEMSPADQINYRRKRLYTICANPRLLRAIKPLADF